MITEIKDKYILTVVIIVLILLLSVQSIRYNNVLGNIKIEEIKCKDIYVVDRTITCPDCVCNETFICPEVDCLECQRCE